MRREAAPWPESYYIETAPQKRWDPVSYTHLQKKGSGILKILRNLTDRKQKENQSVHRKDSYKKQSHL